VLAVLFAVVGIGVVALVVRRRGQEREALP
jgi:hypothetical protein